MSTDTTDDFVTWHLRAALKAQADLHRTIMEFAARRKAFSDARKHHVVQLHDEAGVSVRSIARELGVSRQVVMQWIEEWNCDEIRKGRK
jgi:transposase-like protein